MPDNSTAPATASATPDPPAWLTQLQAWIDSGTIERAWSCVDSRETVKVRRSSGDVQGARVHAVTHAGRGVVLAFMTDDGERFRSVTTEDFLELNPALDLGRAADS